MADTITTILLLVNIFKTGVFVFSWESDVGTGLGSASGRAGGRRPAAGRLSPTLCWSLRLLPCSRLAELRDCGWRVSVLGAPEPNAAGGGGKRRKCVVPRAWRAAVGGPGSEGLHLRLASSCASAPGGGLGPPRNPRPHRGHGLRRAACESGATDSTRTTWRRPLSVCDSRRQRPPAVPGAARPACPRPRPPQPRPPQPQPPAPPCATPAGVSEQRPGSRPRPLLKVSF